MRQSKSMTWKTLDNREIKTTEKIKLIFFIILLLLERDEKECEKSKSIDVEINVGQDGVEMGET